MKDCAEFCCSAFIYFIPLVLQGVGFLTPNWITNDYCRLGLFYSCCGNSCQIYNADTYISKLALQLQATSSAILLFTVIYKGRVLCCKGEDDDRGIVHRCCRRVWFFLFYPSSGVLSFVSCEIFRTHNRTYSLGFSYYLAVVAGCFTILQVILMWCHKICSNNDGGGYGSGYAARPEMAISTTTSSGQSVITREESGESGGIAFARIQIVRIMRNNHITD